MRHEIDKAAFYFLIFPVKIWSRTSISTQIHAGTTYFWIWLFSRTAYQRHEESEAGKRNWWATSVWSNKNNLRRNLNSDFFIVTMRRVAIIFLELEVVKNFMQKINLKTLHDFFFCSKNMLHCNNFICKYNLSSDARLMNNTVKKAICIWACIIILSNSCNIGKPYPLHLNTRI